MKALLDQLDEIASGVPVNPNQGTSNPLESLEGLYRLPHGGYLRKLKDGSYLEETEAQIKRYLTNKGFSAKRGPNENVSAADRMLIEISERKRPEYVGRLSNAPRGEQYNNGHFIVITEESPIVEPAKGTYDTIWTLLQHLLQPAELEFFLTWLATSLAVYNARRTDPAPALFLVGPASDGKSLTLEQIVKPLLGGRSAAPVGIYKEEEGFNGELAEATLLLLDDPPGRVTHAHRLHATAKIKELVAASTHRIEKKYYQAQNFEIFWRVVILSNTGEEHLLALPVFDSAIQDKVLLLHTRGGKEGWKDGERPFPFKTQSLEERATLDKRISDEMPAFAWFLLKEHTPAPNTIGKRFAVAAYLDPKLLAKLEKRTREKQLLHLIYLCNKLDWSKEHPLTRSFVTKGKNPIDISAEELREALTAPDSGCTSAARGLIGGGWTEACSTYLGRLAAQCTDKVKKVREDEVAGTIWRIYPIDWARRLQAEKSKNRHFDLLSSAQAWAEERLGGAQTPHVEEWEDYNLLLEAGWEQERKDRLAEEEASAEEERATG